MEHYCTECDGHFKSSKFDPIVGLCKRCAKPFKKRHKGVKEILAHYSDVSVGDLMWYGRHACMVVDTHPTGWNIVYIDTGRRQRIVVNMFDVFENFALTFRRFRENNETDKK